MKKSKKFAIDVGLVLASSVVIKFLNILKQPIMARYLGPAGLGLYSIATTVVFLVEIVAGFGVPFAIIKYVAEYKDRKDKLQSLVSSAVITMLAFGTISSILLFIFSDRIANILDMPSLSFILKLYAFSLPFSLTYSVVINYFNGLLQMKYYSYIEIYKGFLSFLIIIILLILGFGVEGAVIGTVFGIIVGSLIAIRLMKKWVNFTISDYKKNTKKITSFGSRMMLSNAINIINYQTDIMMIAYFLTVKDVGYYSIAISFSQFFWILPNSLQRIAYPATSEYWTNDKSQSLNKMINKTMKLSAIILLSMGLGLWFFAEDIIVLFFGHQFTIAIEPLRILLIGTIIIGIFKSIGGTLPAIGYPGLGFKINSTSAIVNILMNITLIPRYGIVGAATATTTSLIIVAALNFYYIAKIAKINFDISWHLLVFGTTFCAIIAHSAISELLNRHITSFLILVIYAAILYRYFLPQEDKGTFKEMIKSAVSKR